jgi:hypothetical protein
MGPRSACSGSLGGVQQGAADEVGHGQAGLAGGPLDAAALIVIDAG